MSEKSINGFFKTLVKLADNLIKFIIYGVLIFSFISFFVCYAMHIFKYPEIFSIKETLWIVPAIILLFGICKFAKLFQEKNEKFLIITLTCVGIIFSLALNLSYNTQPCSDYYVLWHSAIEMANGTFKDGIIPGTYMYNYTWQLGTAFFESIIIRIFGENFTVLKVLNTILLLAINYLTYSICKRKFGYKIACYTYTFATAFLPWVLTYPQFTNHHTGTFLILIALYLVEKNTYLSWIIAGLLIGLLNVVRPVGIIIILSAVCFAIYKIIKERQFKIIIKFITMILAYTLVITIFNQLFLSFGYTDMKASESRIPYFKFQVGLGSLPELDKIVSNYENYDAYNEAMKEKLITQIKEEPKSTIVFVANKLCRYFGMFDYQFEMTYNHDADIYTKYPYKALYSTSWFEYIALILLAFIGIKSYAKQNGITDIYTIFFVGNSLVYIFIEANSNYRFESYILLLILASLGFEKLCKHIKKIKQKSK